MFGAFAAHRKGWRWTQWTIIFIAISTIVTTLLTEETFHSTIQRRIAKKRGEKVAELPPLRHRLREFAVVGLVRPIHMLFLEPIVAFTSLYVSAGFGVLFSFFAALPYTFGSVYGFTTEQSGLVFLPIVVGCVLGFATLVLCDLLIYRPLAVRSRPRRAAPEHRLYAAMIGSVGFPLGLFWFAWTARPSVSWASPAAAVVPFAWGNLCLFVSVVQYMADTYQGTVVASAGSANSLARYAFAGAFPLFITQSRWPFSPCRVLFFLLGVSMLTFWTVFEKLGIAWGASLLGFLSLALLPIPWVLFKYGPTIRSKSKYETVRYED